MTHALPLSRRRAHGFTMLEVLISIVVIAFGMLGVAGLQAFALKNSQGATLRSVATVLAADLIDRMKANPQGSSEGFYVTSEGKQGAAAEKSNCLEVNGCANAQELASHDLWEWTNAVTAALPNAEATVCRDSTPNDGTSAASAACDNTGALVIKIWWIDDRTAGNTSKARTLFATQFQI